MQNKKARLFPEKLGSLFDGLKFFTYHKEGTVEDLSKFLENCKTRKHVDYTTALRVAQKLKDRDLIRLDRLERTAERGKEKRIYQIGFDGLMIEAAMDETFNLEDVAHAHPDMLLTFEKIDYLKEKGLLDFVKIGWRENLKMEYETQLIMQLSVHFRPKRYDAEGSRQQADAHILGIMFLAFEPPQAKNFLTKEWGPHTWTDFLKMLKVIEEDYELHQLKNKFLAEIKSRSEEQLKALDAWNKTNRSV